MPLDPEENTIAITTRAAFVEEARRFLGVRWQHQGRSERGIDCVGLLVVPALELGVLRADQDVVDYQRAPHGDRLDVLLHKHCRRLASWQEAREADVLAIKFVDQPQHVMIVSRAFDPRWGFHVIHAFGNSEAGGEVVEHRLDETWLRSHRAKIHAAFHIRGIE
jgi:hypothetical protein